MNNELISIITPAYNAELFISQTIESILNQTYCKWELIIVDDKSIDNTIKIVKEFANKDQRINLIQLNKNSGPAIARNRGIKEAKGNYLTFIDSDDLWDKEFLKKNIEFIEKNNYSFVFSSYRRTNENLIKIYEDYIVPEKVNYSDLLKSNRISCLTAFIDLSKVGKLYMNETFNSHEDYALWLKILKKIDYAYGIEEVLATYRIRTNSISRNKFKMAKTQWKFLREIEKLSLSKSVYYFILYAYNGLKKYS